MIKVKGKIVTFTGKDAKWLERESKDVGMSRQDFFYRMYVGSAYAICTKRSIS